MNPTELAALAGEIEALRAAVEADGAALSAPWQDWLEGSDFAPSARNLGHYLALRRRDLRPLQQRLSAQGLSAMGGIEGRVMPALDALAHVLALASGGAAGPAPDPAAFTAGEARLAARADAILGHCGAESPVRLMVTLPSEAADDPGFVRDLARQGVEAVRINCAHDDEAAWAAMIGYVRAATAAGDGTAMRVVMDLPGPKIRTGARRKPPKGEPLTVGDRLAITRSGRLADAPGSLGAIECALDAALAASGAGDRVYVDDGKLATRVRAVHPWGIEVVIEACASDKGYKLKPEKGINFPDAELAIPALTEADRALLPFVARHADAIDFSFVQTPQDVADLQDALAEARPADWQRLGLILKIETRLALRNLPALMVRAASRQPAAVMIARGDLAVEVGFARVAEMQEEILWLCEAARVPVVWATQVMESFIKSGVPSRGEMTDAAMAARAEGVMLNKGAHIIEAIGMLDRLHLRMGEHVAKKRYRLRPLQSW